MHLGPALSVKNKTGKDEGKRQRHHIRADREVAGRSARHLPSSKNFATIRQARVNRIYVSQFLTIALLHLLAVASPGPDFAMVVRQSFAHGRRTAIWTSIGIGLGILLHVTYSLLGIGLLISRSILLFNILKIAGAIYLACIGWKALRAMPHSPVAENFQRVLPSKRCALATGFLTNAFNPKATLFFLSVFSVVIDPRTPAFVQAIYGIWMSAATMAWFSCVSVLFTHGAVRDLFARWSHWIERAMGAALIALGIKLAATTR
jgi:RhtB (resistance to homoserine/threonine) family protein